jgi:hypothetical protein
MTSLGLPEGADDRPESTWNRRQEHMGIPESARHQPGSTRNHSGVVWENTISFGNAAGVPGIYNYYILFNDF